MSQSADLNDILALDPMAADRFDGGSGMQQEVASEGAQRLLTSLRRRWWFYLLAVLAAGAAAYHVAEEYGSYEYTAQGLVERNNIPFPPGKDYYTPPNTEGFERYLRHPAVIDKLRNDFNVLEEPGAQGSFFQSKYERGSNVVSVNSTRDTAEEAADIVNQAIQSAIEKSVEERKLTLDESLRYFNSLVGKAEAEAADKRLRKAQRLNELRALNADNREAEIEFEELTQRYRRQQEGVHQLKSQLVNSQRLKEFLETDQQEIVVRIRDSVMEQVQQDLKQASERFASGSRQNQELQAQVEQVRLLGEKEVTNREELRDQLREVFQLIGQDYGLPAEDASLLRKIHDELYVIRNQMVLLPQQIEDAEQAMQQTRDRRAEIQPAAELDFENTPEILELTVQIDRAERNAEQIANAVAWVRDMQTLDTPIYEVLMPATADRAVGKGNHKKLMVGVFALVSFLLASPLLALDVLRSPKTPSERLGYEFGIPTLSAQDLNGGRLSQGSALQANDPELRLLALRIQRSARDARGSVVLFSSLSDHISTANLTQAIASCLAAREERVMIIDLEPIDDHRMGTGVTVNRLALTGPNEALQTRVDDPSFESDESAAAADSGDVENSSAVSAENGHANGDDNGHGPVNGHVNGNGSTNGNGHVGGGLSSGRMGLALALAGGTRDPEDVLIERSDDGIDRVHLGTGELPVEAFAAPLMAKLLDRYRNEYSMVLLSGPAAKHIADVQMLASRCDGTLFVAPEKGKISPIARRTITDLLRSNATIMGIAQVPN